MAFETLADYIDPTQIATANNPPQAPDPVAASMANYQPGGGMYTVSNLPQPQTGPYQVALPVYPGGQPGMGAAPPVAAPPAASPQTAPPGSLWERLGNFMSNPQNIQGMANIALGGLAAGQGKYGDFLRQNVLQQEMALRQQQQDRANLLQNAQLAMQGLQSGTKLGQLVGQQALKQMGFPDDTIKALAKEDSDTLANMYAPAIQALMEQNPNLTLSGAQAIISRMPAHELFGLMKETGKQIENAKVQKALQQVGPPAPPVTQAPVPMAPMTPQSSTSGKPTDPFAARIDQINASYQPRIDAFDAKKQELQARQDALKRLDVSPERKKEAFALIERDLDNNARDRAAVMSEMNGHLQRVERERSENARDVRQQEAQNRADARQQIGINAVTSRMMDMQDRIDRRSQELMLNRPLDKDVADSVATMSENLIVARRMKNEFTDAERAKYIGMINNPVQRFQQTFMRDPNSPEAKQFAKFENLANEVKGFAFAEGGKNLTGTEKEITWGHIPTGTEFNLAKFNANLDRTIERTQSLIDRKINLATTPRRGISSSGGDVNIQKLPKVGDVQQGYRFKGGNPAVQGNWVKVAP